MFNSVPDIKSINPCLWPSYQPPKYQQQNASVGSFHLAAGRGIKALAVQPSSQVKNAPVGREMERGPSPT